MPLTGESRSFAAHCNRTHAAPSASLDPESLPATARTGASALPNPVLTVFLHNRPVTDRWVEPVVLEGAHVRIEPMEPRHAEGLFEIGKEPSIWEWLFRGPFVSLEDAQGYIAQIVAARETGSEFGFAAIHRAGARVCGTTRYLDIRPQDRAIEIGWTWYGVEFQRTAVNTECKLLLMEHAFER